MAMLHLGLRAAPTPEPEAPTAVRPGRLPSARPGLAVLALSNLVMVAVMTMAPVQMSHHGERGLGLIGLVISVHIIGMFAPSALSAGLVQRIGATGTAVLAGCVMAAACAFAAATASHWTLGVAMAALGVGWNLGLVSGSAMLTAAVPREVRAAREGLGEVGMGVAAAVGGLACGPLVAHGGYVALAMAGAVAAALIPALAVARPNR
jgi:MFS family permease